MYPLWTVAKFCLDKQKIVRLLWKCFCNNVLFESMFCSFVSCFSFFAFFFDEKSVTKRLCFMEPIEIFLFMIHFPIFLLVFLVNSLHFSGEKHTHYGAKWSDVIGLSKIEIISLSSFEIFRILNWEYIWDLKWHGRHIWK